MDQVKTGQFIKACRKEKALTQREVAEKLNISEKTVSKWETGNGLPEVGFMLPLCNLLEISVNELIQEKAEAKKKLIIAVIVALAMLAAGLTIIILADLLVMQFWLKVVLSVGGSVIILVGVGIACVLERDAGVYECKHCGERLCPRWRHIFSRRILSQAEG